MLSTQTTPGVVCKLRVFWIDDPMMMAILLTDFSDVRTVQMCASLPLEIGWCFFKTLFHLIRPTSPLQTTLQILPPLANWKVPFTLVLTKLSSSSVAYASLQVWNGFHNKLLSNVSLFYQFGIKKFFFSMYWCALIRIRFAQINQTFHSTILVFIIVVSLHSDAYLRSLRFLTK